MPSSLKDLIAERDPLIDFLLEESTLVEKEDLEEVTRRQLDTLPPQLRLILELSPGVGGLEHSVQQLASVLGVSEEKVRRDARRARQAMRGVATVAADPDLENFQFPTAPSSSLIDVVSTVRKLSPALIDHLRSKKDDLRKIRWQVFEHLVAEFLTQHGFKDVRLVGRDRQTSADIYATQVVDSTGIVLKVFVEVKRWKDVVGVSVINEVAGAMFIEKEKIGWHAGMIVAVGGFSDIEKISKPGLSLKGLELKDKTDLLRWLDGYTPNKNGLWLPAPKRLLPRIHT